MVQSIKDIKLAVAMQGWQQDYENYLKSGKTIRVWCAENNLSTSTFSYRLRRLRQEAIARANNPNFASAENDTPVSLEIAKIELQSVPEKAAGNIHIKVGNAEIDLSTAIASEQLKNILEVVCHA